MSRRLTTRQGIRLQIAANQKWRCKICGELLEATFEVDHIIPICFQGQEIFPNFQVLCVKCHRNKTMRERQILADHTREEKTGKSKYFDPECFSFWKRKR